MFGPENGGLIFSAPINVGVVRIDHDQALPEHNLPSVSVEKEWAVGGVYLAL